MSVTTNIAQHVLWGAHPALQAGVAWVMFQRKLHRAFPMFFAYLVAQIAIFVVIFPLSEWGSYPAFFYAYWITTFLSVVLGFKVIHEVFLDVFRPYHTLRDLGTVLFKWAGLVMLMVAGVVAASTTGADDEPLRAGILTLQRSVRVVQVGLVLFLLLFSRYLCINWKQKSFGIALGLGGYAGVELLLVAFNGGGTSDRAQTLTALLNMAAYNLAILTWMAYALARSPERAAVANSVQSRRWEQSLTDLQHPASGDSLIPMFEGMVDRALSRSQDHAGAISQVLAQTDTVLAKQVTPTAAPFEARPLVVRQMASKG